MTVSIPCSSYSHAIAVGAGTCVGCGHQVTSEERAALEARLAASNVEYRKAKSVVRRALTVALVTGLLMLALAGVYFLGAVSAELEDGDAAVSIPIVLQALVGIALVAVFVAGNRLPILVAPAAVLWLATLAVPFILAPGTALLGLASPGGVAVNLARIGVLMMLLHAIPAALRMKRLLGGNASPRAL